MYSSLLHLVHHMVCPALTWRKRQLQQAAELVACCCRNLYTVVVSTAVATGEHLVMSFAILGPPLPLLAVEEVTHGWTILLILAPQTCDIWTWSWSKLEHVQQQQQQQAAASLIWERDAALKKKKIALTHEACCSPSAADDDDNAVVRWRSYKPRALLVQHKQLLQKTRSLLTSSLVLLRPVHGFQYCSLENSPSPWVVRCTAAD